MSASFASVATSGLREVLSLALQLSLPLLGALVAVAVVTGVVQSAIGIRERTISVVPRLLVGLLVLSMVGSWVGGRVTGLLSTSLGAVPSAGRAVHAR